MTKTIPSTIVCTTTTYAENALFPVDEHFHNITLPKVPSYEFRVVEWTDVNDKIVKVGLQVKENIHNQWGSIETYNDWKDVERIKMRQY